MNIIINLGMAELMHSIATCICMCVCCCRTRWRMACTLPPPWAGSLSWPLCWPSSWRELTPLLEWLAGSRPTSHGTYPATNFLLSSIQLLGQWLNGCVVAVPVFLCIWKTWLANLSLSYEWQAKLCEFETFFSKLLYREPGELKTLNLI